MKFNDAYVFREMICSAIYSLPRLRGGKISSRLICSYLLKNMILSLHRREALDAIVFQMNVRSLTCFVFRYLIEIVMGLVGLYRSAPIIYLMAVLHLFSVVVQYLLRKLAQLIFGSTNVQAIY